MNEYFCPECRGVITPFNESHGTFVCDVCGFVKNGFDEYKELQVTKEVKSFMKDGFCCGQQMDYRPLPEVEMIICRKCGSCQFKYMFPSSQRKGKKTNE